MTGWDTSVARWDSNTKTMKYVGYTGALKLGNVLDAKPDQYGQNLRNIYSEGKVEIYCNYCKKWLYLKEDLPWHTDPSTGKTIYWYDDIINGGNEGDGVWDAPLHNCVGARIEWGFTVPEGALILEIKLVPKPSNYNELIN